MISKWTRALIPIVFVIGLLTYGLLSKTIPRSDPFYLFQDHKGESRIQPPFHFDDVAKISGVTHVHEVYEPSSEAKNTYPRNHMNASISVADFDNDGRMDLFFTTQKEGKRNYLYRNLGNWQFKDVTEEAGLGVDNNNPGNSVAAVFFDYDNDGWKDLYVAKTGCHKLFKNVKGKYTDVSQQLEIDQVCGFSTGVNVFDFNKDGFLDLFITNFFDSGPIHAGKEYVQAVTMTSHNRDGGPDYVLKNFGGKKFKDIAPELGVADTGLGWASGISDIDSDGYPDIYIANDFGYDTMYKNIKGTRFENITMKLVGIQPTRNGMNADFGDFNHSGTSSVYVTNVSKIGKKRGSNLLLLPKPDGTFVNISMRFGVDKCGWGWGAKFFDADRNGWLDIVTVNGFWNNGEGNDYWYKWATLDSLPAFIRSNATIHPDSRGTQMAANQPSCLFLRTKGQFVDVAEQTGIKDTLEGRGIAIVDIDNDGALDIVIANHNAAPLIYRQTPQNSSNWIGLKLVGTKSYNRDAIGAKLKVTTSSFTQSMQIYPANGYASQSDSRAYFGLGTNTNATIEIQWPNGKFQKISGLSINKYHDITESP